MSVRVATSDIATRSGPVSWLVATGHLASDRLHLRLDAERRLLHLEARLGGRPAVRAPLEEPHADAPLQRADAPRHRGVVHAQRAGGAGDGARARHGEEEAEIVPIAGEAGHARPRSATGGALLHERSAEFCGMSDARGRA